MKIIKAGLVALVLLSCLPGVAFSQSAAKFVLDDFDDTVDPGGRGYSSAGWARAESETENVKKGRSLKWISSAPEVKGVQQPLFRTGDGGDTYLELDLARYADSQGDVIRFWIYLDETTQQFPGFIGGQLTLATGNYQTSSTWGFAVPAATGWTQIVLDSTRPTSVSKAGGVDWTSVDRFMFRFFNPDLKAGQGPFVVLLDELELVDTAQVVVTETTQSRLPCRYRVLENFESLSVVEAGQGGKIFRNTSPYYVQSGASCRVTDYDGGSVHVQSTPSERQDDLSGLDSFRVNLHFVDVHRMDRSRADNLSLTLFSSDGTRWNRWYLPLPSQNGRAAFEKRFSRFDADDGGGPLDLSAVGRWRLDIRRIDGDEEFTFFIDDLVALPSRFRETPTHWIGRTDDLIGSVGRTNGLLEELQTVSGRPMTILPRTPRGLEVTIKNVTRNWSSVPGGVSHYKTSAGWGEDGRYQRIVCQYVLDEKFNDTLELKGQYTFLDERLDIQFAVKYLKDSPDHHEIMVGQQYVPLHWESEIYTPSLEFMTRDPVPAPVGEILLQYADTYDSFYDFREAKSWVKSYNYGGRAPFVDLPLGVLQNNDTFFLWCYRDLGRHVNLAPRRHGRIPSFLISPSSLKAGGGYRFDFSYKSFSRPLHTYRDVFRWYAENVTSTHPASAGLVTRPKDLPQRTIHHGNLSTMGMYNYGALGHSWSDLEDIRNGRALNLRMTNAWGAYWIMDEVYRTTGIFRPYQSHDTTPEELRKYFLKMKKKGFKIYLYYRQLLVDTYPDKIPFSRWKLVGRDGRAMQYAHGPVDATKRSHQFADFTNPEFRDWYIDRVKQSIVYFDPDAVAWDMGWGDIYTRYAACDPPREGNGIHHGILRVQAEVYQWLKANFPEKKVTINLSGGTPSALYADGVMFEGGNVPRRDSEAYKAYGIDVINLTYSDHYKNGSPDVHIQSIMRAFSRGATWATTTGELYEHPDPEDVSGHTRGLGLYLNNMEVLADYSALANSLPLLTETHVVITSHVDMPVSAWADAEHLLVAVFNDTQRPGEFSLELNREILRKHGFSGSPPMRALHFNSHGLPDTLDISLLQTITPENNLQWTGKFGPGELVLIVKDLPENHRLPDHLFLSSEKYEFVENPKCEPGEQVEVKVEVVDTFDRRIAQANDYTVTITGAGQEKRVSGKTDEQGIATMTVTLPHEGTVKLEASSGSLAARQSHRGLSLTFKQATSKLIDGFVKVKQLKKTGAVNHVTQTSLEVKEGKVAAKLELDPMLSLHGSVKKRLSAPLDLSKYSNGGFIGWWMYRDGPGSLESVTLIVGQRELATFQGPFSSGWQYYKTNVLLPGSLSDYRFDFAGLQGEKFSLLIDDLRVHQ